MHFGRTNPHNSYCMGGYAPADTVLEKVSEEKDIGVIVRKSLKPSNQCAKVAKKAKCSWADEQKFPVQYRETETKICGYCFT